MNIFKYLLLASMLAVTITLCMTANSVRARNKNQYSTNSVEQQQRNRRQSLKQHPGFYFLLNKFIVDTVHETKVAYRNISKIFNDQFTTTLPPPTTPTDGNSTTTTTPAPLTMQQLFDVLGRNYRGLARLFDREWHTALNDSHRNVVQFRRDFKESLIPFFEPNPNITNHQYNNLTDIY